MDYWAGLQCLNLWLMLKNLKNSQRCWVLLHSSVTTACCQAGRVSCKNWLTRELHVENISVGPWSFLAFGRSERKVCCMDEGWKAAFPSASSSTKGCPRPWEEALTALAWLAVPSAAHSTAWSPCWQREREKKPRLHSLQRIQRAHTSSSRLG